jgi:hypothetical protein
MAIITHDDIAALASRLPGHAGQLAGSSERRDIELAAYLLREFLGGRISIMSWQLVVCAPEDLPEPSRASHSSS